MNSNIMAQVPSDHPLYNIGAVSRMTDISIATLRAWENRYGFPHSGRTAGGHRLYSEQDVVRLRWVKAQIDQGLQTAQAIQALQFFEAEGQAVTAPASTLSLPAAPPDGLPQNLLNLRERLFDALVHHDTYRADEMLGQAVLVHPLDELIFAVLVPVVNEIGQYWEEGKLNIATEHLATNYVRHHMMLWMLSGPPPFGVRPVLLACAPGELHEGSLLIVGALLRRRRWAVAYLGQSVPLPDLASMVRDIRPPAVVLVAMREESAAALAEWPQHLPDALRTGQPAIGYGGRIFTVNPTWRERVPGIYLGETLEQGIETLDRILQAVRVT